jgi:hypothetical protein
MHKIQSTYLYSCPASVYFPIDGFSAIGFQANPEGSILSAVKKAEDVLQCNFPLYSHNNNINQHQHAADKTAVILTKNIQLKKNQFDYS